MNLNFQNTKVLVVGDICIDVDVVGTATRISPEAPVPILADCYRERRLGMAGNVLNNIHALGGNAHLVTVIGPDEPFQPKTTITAFIDKNRKTTHKLRFKAGQYQLLRLDVEDTDDISRNIEEKILKLLHKKIKHYDIVVLQDYGKGVLTPTLSKKIIDLATKYKKRVIVDPCKKASWIKYRGAYLLTPNQEEADALGPIILDHFNVLLTCGADGMCLYQPHTCTSIPSYANKVVDVTGAGDTVISTVSVALASGMSLEESMELANKAAAVVVSKAGTATCSFEELKTIT